MSDTFDCLQSVNSTEIMSGWAAAAARTQVLFPWTPTLDGPDGLIPALPSVMLANGNLSRLPFIAGTNMDEVSRPYNSTVTPTYEFTKLFR
jgi:carboxylesterase type B